MLHKIKLIDGVQIYRRGIGYLFRLQNLGHLLNVDLDGLINTAIKTSGKMQKRAIDKVLASYYNAIPFEYLEWVLMSFTDVKHPRLLAWTDKKKALKLVRQVFDWNKDAAAADGKGSSATESDVIASIVDIIAAAYGWTLDYIMENIDIHQARALVKQINARQKSDAYIQIMVHHQPEELIKMLDQASGIEHMTLEQAIERAKEQKGGQNGRGMR